jgi:acyl carrier protein
MNTAEIRRTVIETLLTAKGRDISTETVEDGTLLGTGGLGVSSLALLQAFVRVEDRFGMTFDDASVADAKFATVGELVAFISQALGRHGITAPREI